METASPINKIIGILVLLFSASTVFASLQNGLNYIWGIKPKPKKGLLQFIMSRVISVAIVVSFGFLLIVSLMLDTALAIFHEYLLQNFSEIGLYIIAVTNVLLLLGLLTVVFALIFKVLPDAKVQWRDVWVGAFITTILLTIGKYALGIYLGNSSLGSAYGAAGSLVLLLIWIYYSSTILLLGATFTYEYARAQGHAILADRYAVLVEEVEKEKD